jgi:hypothetical protein
MWLERHIPTTILHPHSLTQYPFNSNPGIRKIQFDQGFLSCQLPGSNFKGIVKLMSPVAKGSARAPACGIRRPRRWPDGRALDSGTLTISPTAVEARGRTPAHARGRVHPNTATPRRLLHFSLCIPHPALPPTQSVSILVHPWFHSSFSSPSLYHFARITDHSALLDYNVTAIADATGDVLERYGYSAFGDVRFMTAAYVTKPASDHGWDLLYKAQFRDWLDTAQFRVGETARAFGEKHGEPRVERSSNQQRTIK